MKSIRNFFVKVWLFSVPFVQVTDGLAQEAGIRVLFPEVWYL